MMDQESINTIIEMYNEWLAEAENKQDILDELNSSTDEVGMMLSKHFRKEHCAFIKNRINKIKTQ